MSSEPVITLSVDEVMAALRHSHERLVSCLAALPDEQADAPSYADEWSIAQVASHLGSGAEIFTLFLEAGSRGEPAPGLEQMQPIWDRWNAKGAPEQVHDAVAADASFLGRLAALGDAERQEWRLDLFGGKNRGGKIADEPAPHHALKGVLAHQAAAFCANSCSSSRLTPCGSASE